MGSWSSAAEAGDINDETGSGKAGESAPEGAVLSLQDRLKWADQHVVRKVVSFPPLLEILVKLLSNVLLLSLSVHDIFLLLNVIPLSVIPPF